MFGKTLLATIGVVGLLAGNAAAEDKSSQSAIDRASVTTIVRAVGVLADRGEFDALKRLFADRLTLDYSSLNGRPATQMTSDQLMAAWARVLPGFDRTHHRISGINVVLSGDRATARADVIADHWLKDRHWQVAGQYDYTFARRDGRWKVTSMTFTLKKEKGSRAIFGPAIKAAAAKTLPGNPSIVGHRNKETVERFFKALERGDIPAAIGLFADDGVQINPYHNDLFPKGATGKKQLLAYWTPIPGRFDGMKFHIRQLLATEDPNIVFVVYRGEIKLKNGAGHYRNTYFSTFRFDKDGRITEYVEVFDPIAAARAFGLLGRLK